MVRPLLNGLPMMKQLVGQLGMGLVALALSSLVGCATVVNGGGDGGDGGTGGATATGTDTGTGTVTGTDVPPDCGDFAPCSPPAYVLTHDQEIAATGGDYNGGLISDTRFLFWGQGAQAPTCGVPYGGSGCGGFNVAVEIPTSYLVVGTIHLNDPEVQTYIQETFGEGGNTCAGTGGIDAAEGTIEITAVTDVNVVFTVTGMPVDSVTNNDMNGSFVAERCP